MQDELSVGEQLQEAVTRCQQLEYKNAILTAQLVAVLEARAGSDAVLNRDAISTGEH